MQDKEVPCTLKAAVSAIRSKKVLLGSLEYYSLDWYCDNEIYFHMFMLNFLQHRKLVTSKTVKSLSIFRPRWRSRQRVSLII